LTCGVGSRLKTPNQLGFVGTELEAVGPHSADDVIEARGNAVSEAGRLCGWTAAVDLGVVCELACTEVVACNEVK
jgi:hypothetical protein